MALLPPRKIDRLAITTPDNKVGIGCKGSQLNLYAVLAFMTADPGISLLDDQFQDQSVAEGGKSMSTSWLKPPSKVDRDEAQDLRDEASEHCRPRPG
jgi:hypothetical protein